MVTATPHDASSSNAPKILPSTSGPAGTNAKPSGKPAGRVDDSLNRDEQLIAAIERIDLDPVQRAYMLERWLGQLQFFGRSARTAQQRFYTFRLVAILGGVTIPALIGLSVDGQWDDWVRWATFILGLLVAGAVAVEEFFRFGERWRHYRHQAELLRGEGWAFLARSGAIYRRQQTPEEAFRTFVARSEETMRQEVGVYITEIVRHTESPKAEGRTASSHAGSPPKGDAQHAAADPE